MLQVHNGEDVKVGAGGLKASRHCSPCSPTRLLSGSCYLRQDTSMLCRACTLEGFSEMCKSEFLNFSLKSRLKHSPISACPRSRAGGPIPVRCLPWHIAASGSHGGSDEWTDTGPDVPGHG